MIIAPIADEADGPPDLGELPQEVIDLCNDLPRLTRRGLPDKRSRQWRRLEAAERRRLWLASSAEGRALLARD
jgi:hypothetical protein